MCPIEKEIITYHALIDLIANNGKIYIISTFVLICKCAHAKARTSILRMMWQYPRALVYIVPPIEANIIIRGDLGNYQSRCYPTKSQSLHIGYLFEFCQQLNGNQLSLLLMHRLNEIKNASNWKSTATYFYFTFPQTRRVERKYYNRWAFRNHALQAR